MTHVTCRLTAKNRQLWNSMLGYQVWATFFYHSVYSLACVCYPGEHQYEILDFVAAKFHEELGVFKLLVIMLTTIIMATTVTVVVIGFDVAIILVFFRFIIYFFRECCSYCRFKSQAKPSSSTSWSRFSPPLNFVHGHVSTMWFMVCRWQDSFRFVYQHIYISVYKAVCVLRTLLDSELWCILLPQTGP